MELKEFTEAELVEIESGVSCGRAFDHRTVDRLVKALRLWNERAHQERKGGLALAHGLNESALKLEDAGSKIKAERDALLLEIETLKTVSAQDAKMIGRFHDRANVAERLNRELRAENEQLKRDLLAAGSELDEMKGIPKQTEKPVVPHPKFTCILCGKPLPGFVACDCKIT